MNLLSGSSPSFFEPNTTGPAGSVRSETAVLAFRVLPTDFDLNLHMNNARSLSPMDLGRVDLLNRLGLLRLAFRGHWVPVLGDVSIRYHRPLELWQRASLPTRILAGVGRVGATAG